MKKKHMNKHQIRQGVQTDPVAIVDDLWLRYFALDPQDQAADKSKKNLVVDDETGA